MLTERVKLIFVKSLKWVNSSSGLGTTLKNRKGVNFTPPPGSAGNM